jgi:uncharacterized protein DUF1559
MTESITDQQYGITRLRQRRKRDFVALAVFGVLIAFGLALVRWVKDAREAAHDAQCRGHFKQLATALLYYHDTFKGFPPAYTTDRDGKPMHSWRVLILPWLEEKAVFAQYDFSKPWNDPGNLKLASQINLDLFHCPSESNHGQSVMTNYVVVVGDQSAFPGQRTTALTDMTDGVENSIFLVEIANSDIHWMEPRDLELAKMSFIVNDPHRAGISSHHPRGPGVSFADGTGIRLAESLRPETLQALITISGQEPVHKQSLILPTDGLGARLGEDSTLPRQ